MEKNLQLQKQLDGFYIGYFTGTGGSSVAIFVFRDGIVTGADMGNGIYNGEYAIDETNEIAEVKIALFLQAGSNSITGVQASSDPINIELSLELPIPISESAVTLIKTPIGPVNAKFRKLRDFNI